MNGGWNIPPPLIGENMKIAIEILKNKVQHFIDEHKIEVVVIGIIIILAIII